MQLKRVHDLAAGSGEATYALAVFASHRQLSCNALIQPPQSCRPSCEEKQDEEQKLHEREVGTHKVADVSSGKEEESRELSTEDIDADVRTLDLSERASPDNVPEAIAKHCQRIVDRGQPLSTKDSGNGQAVEANKDDNPNEIEPTTVLGETAEDKEGLEDSDITNNFHIELPLLHAKDFDVFIDASDPFTYKAYDSRFPLLRCDTFSFEDIEDGAFSLQVENEKEEDDDDKLDDGGADNGEMGEAPRYDLIVCCFALHLAQESRMHCLFTQLALNCRHLIVVTPHKRPDVKEQMGFRLVEEALLERVRVRLYRTEFM